MCCSTLLDILWPLLLVAAATAPAAVRIDILWRARVRYIYVFACTTATKYRFDGIGFFSWQKCQRQLKNEKN